MAEERCHFTQRIYIPLPLTIEKLAAALLQGRLADDQRVKTLGCRISLRSNRVLIKLRNNGLALQSVHGIRRVRNFCRFFDF